MNVKMRRIFFIITFTTGLMVLVGCRTAGGTLPPTGPTETVFVEPTPEITVEFPTTENPTDTPPPADTPLPTNTTVAEATVTTQPPTITPTPRTQCTVLTELNFRFGPGTAYRPRVRALPAGYEVIPVGFNPSGIPGGSWVQVRDEERNEVGWLSAGQQFVSCNIDLNILPQVAVAPPPPPPPPSLTNSVPDGSCSGDWECEIVFHPDFLVRIVVYDTNLYANPVDGDGITSVSFSVLNSNGQEVYQRLVTSTPFCIFGGSGTSCNTWIIEDHLHRWTPGGPPVESGDYILQIFVDGEEFETGNWTIDLNLQQLP
jgi:uncharacterized protein YraI